MADKKTAADFAELRKEWAEYYEGKVVHPETDEEVTKPVLRDYEIGRIVKKEVLNLQAKIRKGKLKADDIESHVYRLGKSSYLATIGAKDDSELDSDVMRQSVEQHIIAIAQRATGQSFENYDDAVAGIMEATNPVHGEGDDRSRALDALIDASASATHESDHKDTQGQTTRRLSYLESELGDRKYLEPWKESDSDVFEKYRRPGHKFEKQIKSPQIMNIVAEALSTDRLTHTTLRKKHVDNPPGPLTETPYKK